MDGRRMGVISHTKESSKTSNAGFRIAIDAHCPYQFAPVTTTGKHSLAPTPNTDLGSGNLDDDDLPSAYSDDLGTIELRLRRVRNFVPVTFTPKIPTAPGFVHERKGNGAAHCVTYVACAHTKLSKITDASWFRLGKKKEVKPQKTILRPLLIDDKPFVSFLFRYRPKGIGHSLAWARIIHTGICSVPEVEGNPSQTGRPACRSSRK